MPFVGYRSSLFPRADTIDEGYEDEPTRHAPPPQIRAAASKYQQAPPRQAPPPQLQQPDKLPAMPGRGAYHEAPVAPMPAGYLNNNKRAIAPQQLQPPPIHPPSDYSQLTPNSQMSQQPWWNQGGANKVSESHANYGAFYHNGSYTPKSALNQAPPPPPWANAKPGQGQQQQQGAQYNGGYQGERECGRVSTTLHVCACGIV